MNHVFAVVLGLAAATLVGVAVYRDATRRRLARPAAYSLAAGISSGVGVAFVTQFANRIVLTTRHAIAGRYVTHPFEVPAATLVMVLVIVGFTLSVYGFSTRHGSAARE